MARPASTEPAAVEAVATPVSEVAVAPEVLTVPEPVIKDAVEHAVEPVVEPAKEQAVEPVVELDVEPAVEHAVEHPVPGPAAHAGDAATNEELAALRERLAQRERQVLTLTEENASLLESVSVFRNQLEQVRSAPSLSHPIPRSQRVVWGVCGGARSLSR